jgi:hypothetical protein
MARYVVLRRKDARGHVPLKDFGTVEDAADFIREQGEIERPGDWHGYWPEDSQHRGQPREPGAVGVWLVKAQRANRPTAETPRVPLYPAEQRRLERRLWPEDRRPD